MERVKFENENLYILDTIKLKTHGKKTSNLCVKPFFDDFPIIFCIFICLNEGADEKGSNYVF